MSVVRLTSIIIIAVDTGSIVLLIKYLLIIHYSLFIIHYSLLIVQ